jgi:hypothetical protein
MPAPSALPMSGLPGATMTPWGPPAFPPVARTATTSTKREFAWAECRVVLPFGSNNIKTDKIVASDSLRIKDYAGFSGEGKQPLADLALLLQMFRDEIERCMWSETAASAILRANVTRSARTLIEGITAWRPILETLFAAFASEKAVAECQQELRALHMQGSENAHTFVARARRMFSLFGASISDAERARVVLAELKRNEASAFPALDPAADVEAAAD